MTVDLKCVRIMKRGENRKENGERLMLAVLFFFVPPFSTSSVLAKFDARQLFN